MKGVNYKHALLIEGNCRIVYLRSSCVIVAGNFGIRCLVGHVEMAKPTRTYAVYGHIKCTDKLSGTFGITVTQARLLIRLGIVSRGVSSTNYGLCSTSLRVYFPQFNEDFMKQSFEPCY